MTRHRIQTFGPLPLVFRCVVVQHRTRSSVTDLTLCSSTLQGRPSPYRWSEGRVSSRCLSPSGRETPSKTPTLNLPLLIILFVEIDLTIRLRFLTLGPFSVHCSWSDPRPDSDSGDPRLDSDSGLPLPYPTSPDVPTRSVLICSRNKPTLLVDHTQWEATDPRLEVYGLSPFTSSRQKGSGGVSP